MAKQEKLTYKLHLNAVKFKCILHLTSNDICIYQLSIYLSLVCTWLFNVLEPMIVLISNIFVSPCKESGPQAKCLGASWVKWLAHVMSGWTNLSLDVRDLMLREGHSHFVLNLGPTNASPSFQGLIKKGW